MSANEYLRWLSRDTLSDWWHDSAIVEELEDAIENGAVGATTNPVLIRLSLSARSDYWRPMIKDIPASFTGSQKAEEIVRIITSHLARKFYPIYERTGENKGFVCAQVSPIKAADAATMLEMARRLSTWAHNICVKLPATAAGLSVLEDCVAEGINVCGTISFTVAQVLAVAERHMKGLERASRNGIKPAKCFAVVMVGRLDDYLRDVAMDRRSNLGETDIIQAGTAVIKRAYGLFKERGYQATLMPAGMRGAYHITHLAGATMSMSIGPKIARMVAERDKPWGVLIDEPVPAEVIERLQTIPEFVRAYDPNGLNVADFITYGLVQRTLSQFVEVGWLPMEGYQI